MGRFNSDEVKKDFKKATDENKISELIPRIRRPTSNELSYVNKGNDRQAKIKLVDEIKAKHESLVNFINFRTNFIKQQMEIIEMVIRDNRKLKSLCEMNNIRWRRGDSSSSSSSRPPRPPSTNINLKTKAKKRSLRSASMEVNPPSSRQPSPSSFITEQPNTKNIKPKSSERISSMEVNPPSSRQPSPSSFMMEESTHDIDIIQPKKNNIKPHSSKRSASLEVHPPSSRQSSLSSLFTIEEKPTSQQLKEQHLEQERQRQRQREQELQKQRQEERELRLKRDTYRHLLGPEKNIPDELKNLEGWDKEWNREEHLEQQKNMNERFRNERGGSSTTTTTTAPKKSSGFKSSNIDYSNMMWEPRRKRTQTQANSGSSGSSSKPPPAKKKCTETYKVGDIVDVTAYGGTHWSATIKKVGPNIAMMGSKRVEIKAGEYLVIFHFDGTYEVVSTRWKRKGWYISKLIARKSEEKPSEGLDLNKMDIKF